jgi:hypothetical protein
MIERVEYKGDIFDYQVFDCLYKSIFDFAIENELDIWTEIKLSVTDNHLSGLIIICESIMKDIIKKYYKHLSERQLSKTQIGI